jgi:hypothetical protein
VPLILRRAHEGRESLDILAQIRLPKKWYVLKYLQSPYPIS